MSLIPTPEDIEQWAGVMERRVIAAKQTEEEYVEAARAAHRGAVAWIDNPSWALGSFKWVCDLLDLEPDAVRKQVKR